MLYQGSKLFWRTRNTIDITIIQHCKFDITEIIAYEPSINVEAKRIYLNSCILIGKLNGGEIDSKLSFAKQNNIALSTQLSDRIIKQAIAEFVLSRLIISQFKREDGCFEVSFLFQSRDGTQHLVGMSSTNWCVPKLLRCGHTRQRTTSSSCKHPFRVVLNKNSLRFRLLCPYVLYLFFWNSVLAKWMPLLMP